MWTPGVSTGAWPAGYSGWRGAPPRMTTRARRRPLRALAAASAGASVVSTEPSADGASGAAPPALTSKSLGVERGKLLPPVPFERVHWVCDAEGVARMREAVMDPTKNPTTREGYPPVVGLDGEWKPGSRTPVSILQVATRTDAFVVDLFAGIGYFALQFLRGGAAFLHACEWNDDAVRFLRANLQRNGFEGRSAVHAGDNRQSAPRIGAVADRVSLGLLPSSEGAWGLLPRCLRLAPAPWQGWAHVHANVHRAERDAWVTAIEAAKLKVATAQAENTANNVMSGGSRTALAASSVASSARPFGTPISARDSGGDAGGGLSPAQIDAELLRSGGKPVGCCVIS